MTGSSPPVTDSGAGPADPLGVVSSALAFGAVVGVALQALVSFGVDALKAGLPP